MYNIQVHVPYEKQQYIKYKECGEPQLDWPRCGWKSMHLQQKIVFNSGVGWNIWNSLFLIVKSFETPCL